MMNVQPPLPELARPAGSNFHSMTPTRVPELQSVPPLLLDGIRLLRVARRVTGL